jgi:hypothetical protein
MPLYEFRIRSQGSTIWVVEHYCRDDDDALEKADTDFGVRVWHNGRPIAHAGKKRSTSPNDDNGQYSSGG